MQLNKFVRFLILFPGIGVFYFILIVVSDYSFWNFELSDLRLFGQPGIMNMIEIPIAACIGLAAAKILRSLSMKINRNQKILFIFATYGLVAFMYIVFPRLEV